MTFHMPISNEGKAKEGGGNLGAVAEGVRKSRYFDRK